MQEAKNREDNSAIGPRQAAGRRRENYCFRSVKYQYVSRFCACASDVDVWRRKARESSWRAEGGVGAAMAEWVVSTTRLSAAPTAPRRSQAGLRGTRAPPLDAGSSNAYGTDRGQGKQC